MPKRVFRNYPFHEKKERSWIGWVVFVVLAGIAAVVFLSRNF